MTGGRLMEKLNCWQFKNCGREKGGLLAHVLGECPVSSALKFDGHNGGLAAGRACWQVDKTSCPGSLANGCHNCEFYRRVLFEEDTEMSGRYHSVTV